MLLYNKNLCWWFKVLSDFCIGLISNLSKKKKKMVMREIINKHCSQRRAFSQNSSLLMNHTTWKMSIFGVFLVGIFPHSDWIQNSVSLCIQSECGKTQTRKTPSTDTFHAVLILIIAITLIYKRKVNNKTILKLW